MVQNMAHTSTTRPTKWASTLQRDVFSTKPIPPKGVRHACVGGTSAISRSCSVAGAGSTLFSCSCLHHVHVAQRKRVVLLFSVRDQIRRPGGVCRGHSIESNNARTAFVQDIPRGGRPLGSGRQLPPQLTVGRRPLGGGGGGGRGGGIGGGGLGGAMGGGGLREGRLGGGGPGGAIWGVGGGGGTGSPYFPLPSL